MMHSIGSEAGQYSAESAIAKDFGSVALFFRSGKPHRLAPTSILMVLNYDSGVNRTLVHRGFLNRVEARRAHTAEELDYLRGCFRYRMEFYRSWSDLICEEEYLLEQNPHIGSGFLERIRQLSRHPGHRPAKPLREPPQLSEAEQVAALVTELEARHHRPDLSDFERRAAVDTARAIGAMQLTLFGEELPVAREAVQYRQAA